MGRILEITWVVSTTFCIIEMVERTDGPLPRVLWFVAALLVFLIHFYLFTELHHTELHHIEGHDTVKQSSSSGLGLGTVLFLIFLVLKLTDNITWSWWWVTSPIWIPVTIILGLVTLAAMIKLGADVRTGFRRRRVLRRQFNAMNKAIPEARAVKRTRGRTK